MSPRVAVTTTRPVPAARIGADLAAAGLDPVFLPCIEVSPGEADTISHLRGEAERCDWIVLTSSRVVDVLWPGGRMPGRPRVAAVGSRTAAAASRAGGSVALVGGGGASGLVDRLTEVIQGASVVYPHARMADPSTLAALLGSGARLSSGWVYETLPIAPSHDEVDAVVFGSPSAVDGWLSSRSLDGLVTAAIGRTTAASLEAAGHPPHVVPATPRFDELVASLATYLNEHRSLT